ncbi:TRAP transporter small permease subunit [Parachitinimonas caeni]|uniref:TRAP transporter small permease protein n=1 Tax=Parachitinimonas caeni TaxID=3031301 RepID=A0ABT7DUL3_9NEIS|nr:TRAP transporter small permease subunit [Parachitinimonas caeni]MDK2123767.1 TRAP transporter small permease subunit [Parachitinimonas caeni]
MHALLRLSKLIDATNEYIGRFARWLVLVMTLICAGNALFRYTFNNSSNGFLEIQWYLFSAVFLLGGGYTLRHNEHIRIDILTGRLSRKGQAWIDIAGGLLFLMPMAILMVYFGWPIFLDAFVKNEMSSDAGGLIRWPVLLLIPVGFSLLTLQAISEIIKRIAFINDLIPDPSEKPNKAEEPV